MSLGWSVSMVFSANASDARTVRRLRVLGPGVLALGLAVAGLTQWNGAGTATVAVWFAALVAAGVGIGVAFPHLIVATMGISDDPADAAKAAAGANTVELIALSFSSALGGVLMNLGAPSTARSAQYLLLGFAVVAALGCLTARRAHRTPTARPSTMEADRRTTVAA